MINLSVFATVTSIVLSIFSIALAIIAIYLSQRSYAMTKDTLRDINSKSESIKETISEHFGKMMSTVLDIVDRATKQPEIRKAELEAKAREQDSQAQETIFKMLQEAVESGDKERLDKFLTAMERIMKATPMQRNR